MGSPGSPVSFSPQREHVYLCAASEMWHCRGSVVDGVTAGSRLPTLGVTHASRTLNQPIGGREDHRITVTAHGKNTRVHARPGHRPALNYNLDLIVN
ncbi:hypothetical protein NDU88_001305 [Pleurodeles waltl]|uniref:Uncharacterized protein n=1 Tax=Pleurodeles waltl TaxID=8319 RepID=A0AAV7TIS0_PLEWA|nr:hypothetical protein NDU88_001305 [Pleurodeles waltl]